MKRRRRQPLADLFLFKRFDHAMFMCHLADPVIRFESHILSNLNFGTEYELSNSRNLCDCHLISQQKQLA